MLKKFLKIDTSYTKVYASTQSKPNTDYNDDTNNGQFAALSMELIVMLLNTLDLKSLGRFSQVNKFFKEVIGNEKTDYDLLAFKEINYYLQKLISQQKIKQIKFTSISSNPSATSFQVTQTPFNSITPLNVTPNATFFQISQKLGLPTTRNRYRRAQQIQNRLQTGTNQQSYNRYQQMNSELNEHSQGQVVIVLGGGLSLLEACLYITLEYIFKTSPTKNLKIDNVFSTFLTVAAIAFILFINIYGVHKLKNKLTAQGKEIFEMIEEEEQTSDSSEYSNLSRRANPSADKYIYDITPHESANKLKRQ